MQSIRKSQAASALRTAATLQPSLHTRPTVQRSQPQPLRSLPQMPLMVVEQPSDPEAPSPGTSVPSYIPRQDPEVPSIPSSPVIPSPAIPNFPDSPENPKAPDESQENQDPETDDPILE